MSNLGGEAAYCPVSLPEIKSWQQLSKTCKIIYYIFEVLSDFTVFLYFLPNILSRIVDKATFINSQFKYAPLIWMFCWKTLYHKIGKIHHRTLEVIYQSEESYESLLLESSSVSVHQRHLRFLVTEIYKSTTQINLEFMWTCFTYNNISYNLRKGPILYLRSTHSRYCSTNSAHLRGSLTWNNLTRDIKSSKSLPEFKTKIKNFGNIDSRCVICSETNLYFKFTLWNNKSIIKKITTSHSMARPTLKNICFFYVLLLSWSVQ